MGSLAAAVGAFLKDLGARKLLDRVLTMSFSEFGRRVKENASRGTDHGVPAPLFLFGNRQKGGIYGKHPSITDLAKGDLRMSVDFRSVYATVIDRWLEASPKKILGAKFPRLGFLPSGRLY